MATPSLEPIIRSMEMARSRYLYGLDCVPDDRLAWSPGGSAKSPLELAARLTVFLTTFSHMLEHGAWPEQRPQPPEVRTRDDAKAAVQAGFDRLAAALSSRTEADLEKQVPTPFGTTTTAYFMVLSLLTVTGYAQGQMNCVQLAYGDENPNIPPGWSP